MFALLSQKSTDCVSVIMYLMKRALISAGACALLLLLTVSCSTTKVTPRQVTEAPPPAPSSQPPKPPAHEYKTVIRCREDTKMTFNSCGIGVLPFIRPFFYDVDGDGSQELIAGSKDGTLRLYKKTDGTPAWIMVPHYFDGVKAGAFSAPAMGDIDGDGKPELLLGTGGFSSDSGQVIVYGNSGSLSRPSWEIVSAGAVRVGNDATPALADLDGDGRPDLIIGNSTGHLQLFRNKSAGGKILFIKDGSCFRNVHLGMYAAPAVTATGRKIIVISGNSMGKLNILEKQVGRSCSWRKAALNISLSSFAAPAFIESRDHHREDLVVSDGDGNLHYFRNGGSYLEWEEISSLFSGRILPGPACAPSVASIDGRRVMVVGNIYGRLKLFEAVSAARSLPWEERADFFKGVKLRGFSRGVLTRWEGKDLLITGEQDGILRAFLNYGSFSDPAWVERKEFFKGLPEMEHAAPAVFDLDGDGRWELIAGDAGGGVRAFRYGTGNNGMTGWSELKEIFRNVKVDRFAAPALYRDYDRLWLLAGEQDGRIMTYIADAGMKGPSVFHENGPLDGIVVKNHSSPSADMKNGLISLSVGDYDGNLRHFSCREERVEVGTR